MKSRGAEGRGGAARAAGGPGPGRRRRAAALALALAAVTAALAGCGGGRPPWDGATFRVLAGNRDAHRGENLDATRSYRLAVQELEAAARGPAREGDRARVAYDLAGVYFSLGELEAALRLLEGAMEGADAELLFRASFNLGALEYSLGRYPQAAAAYVEALRLKPGAWPAKVNLELCLKRMQAAASGATSPRTGHPPARARRPPSPAGAGGPGDPERAAARGEDVLADRGKPAGLAAGLVTAALVLLLGCGAALPAEGEERELRLRDWEEIRGSVPLRLHRRPAAWLLALPGPLGLAGCELARRAGRGGGRRPAGHWPGSRRAGFRRFGNRLPLLAAGLLLLLPAGGEAGGAKEQAGAPRHPASEPAAGWAEQAREAALRGETAAALRLYGQVETALPDSAALQWNLAALQRRASRPAAGRTAQAQAPAAQATAAAVHHLRRAVRLDPLDREARRELRELEREAGLAAQFPPGAALPPDAPFVAFLALANLAAASAALFRRRSARGAPAPGLLALTVLLALLGLVCLAGLAGLRLGEGRPTGVAAAGGSLSRIPEPDARGGAPLPAGTALRLRGGVTGWWLAETGLGVRGWIPRAGVLVDDPLVDDPRGL